MHMPAFTVKTTHIPKQQKKAQTLNKWIKETILLILKNWPNTHIDIFLTKSLKYTILTITCTLKAETVATSPTPPTDVFSLL